MFKGKLRDYQEEAVERMVDRGQMLLGMVMGAGKGHPDGTPILTPNGYVPIEDIHVGDLVIGADGSPTQVTGVYPRGYQPCYLVTFNDRTSTVVDSDHLWYVESPSDRYKKRKGKVLATWKLASSDHIESSRFPGKSFNTYFRDRHGNLRWSIPTCKPPQFSPGSPLPIDPYTLGVILGDGSIAPNSVLVHCHADDAEEMFHAVVGGGQPPRANGSCWAFSVRGILPHLRELGLMGTTTSSKFVPKQYLLASAEDRLAILQGLMDTDGFTGKKGTVEFSSTSPRLAEDVCFLARSLGGYAYIRQKPTTCTYKGEIVRGTSWRVTFKLDANPFRLKRKRTAYRRPLKYKELRVITNVEPVDPTPTTCISVAASDHLYVIHDFIVTHNTPSALGAVESLVDEGEVDRCLVVVPASLKYQWKREIEKFTDSSLTVIDGDAKKRAEQWRTSQRTLYTIVNPETLLNDTKNMGTFQCIVVDEATIIKNRSSKRSRLLKKIGKTIPYRFALTGQPIENRPEEVFSIMEFVDSQVLGKFDSFDQTFIVRDHWGKPLRYRNLDMMNRIMQECMVRKTFDDIKDQMPEVQHTLIPVPFDPAGAKLYRHIAADLLTQIQSAVSHGSGSFNLWAHYNDPAGKEAQGQVMSRLTVLRMLCDNPELISLSAGMFDDPDSKEGSEYASKVVSAGWMDHLKSAPKLDACLEYIKEVLAEDPKNKVVLFSFFKKNLKLIKEAMGSTTESVLFMGGMSSTERDASKQKFSTDPNCRLFLSSDAGGYGVDLPIANYCISYDLPWSSGKLEQREARIIRLSSEFRHVNITTFVMKGSIEERQYEMLQHKKMVNEAFIDGKHLDDKSGMEITLDTLSTFLRESEV